MNEDRALAALKRGGASSDLIARLGSDEAYAKCIANFMAIVDRHQRVWVGTTGDGRVHCVRCGDAAVPMCVSCEESLRIL